MSQCEICDQDMRKASTCLDIDIGYPDGLTLKPNYFRSYNGITRCPDCNVVEFGFHHQDCAIERCPRCDGQLLSCDCFDKQHKEEEEEKMSNEKIISLVVALDHAIDDYNIHHVIEAISMINYVRKVKANIYTSEDAMNAWSANLEMKNKISHLLVETAKKLLDDK